MQKLIRLFLMIFCVALVVNVARAQQVMDNAAVLKLEKAGLGDDLIVSTINGQPGHYSLSTDDMISLKQSGVSDKVISAMVSKNAGASAVAPTPIAAVAPVDEVGVYYKDKAGNWTFLMPEVVNFKTGGVLKSLATAGIVKGDLNGHIKGVTSSLDLAKPVVILLYVPEGTAPTEYQLLKLHQNSDNREFRSVTGGIYHVSTGAGGDQIDFQYTKIAPRTYQVLLPPGTVPGQYGILPPGSNGGTVSTSASKMYTFHLVE